MSIAWGSSFIEMKKYGCISLSSHALFSSNRLSRSSPFCPDTTVSFMGAVFSGLSWQYCPCANRRAVRKGVRCRPGLEGVHQEVHQQDINGQKGQRRHYLKLDDVVFVL